MSAKRQGYAVRAAMAVLWGALEAAAHRHPDVVEPDPAHPVHLITEPSMGYRFEP